MSGIDRIDARERICITLQNNYIALLAQRGAQSQAIVNAFLNPKTVSSGSGMKFMYFALARNTDRDFEGIFLERLLDAVDSLPDENVLIESVKQAVAKFPVKYTTTSRIRRVLDTLGRETSKHLVIILRTSVHVADNPLRNLLTMLREYHEQLGNHGNPGDKLRFMVVGGADLWKLCWHTTPDLSPFNIAHRMLLDDFSPQELQKVEVAKDVVTASRLHTLTGGVPMLIEEVIERKEDSLQNLGPYFRRLRDDWNALVPESQEALKLVATGSQVFPECDYDEHIPIVGAPWQDAFWKGFLRRKLCSLTWRSPIHYMFVRRSVNDKENYSVLQGMNIGLQESIACLEKAVQKESYAEYKDEMLREAHALAYQTSLYEIYAPLEAMIYQETNERIVEKCQQVSKEFGEQALQHKDILDVFLIKTVLSRAKGFVTVPNQFVNDGLKKPAILLDEKQVIPDVFISYNRKDKKEVIEIDKHLKEKGIVTFLDQTDLPLGEPWPPLLEERISQARSAAVFLGKHGLGRVQQDEVSALLHERKKIIPIILASAPDDLKIPSFLAIRTYIDFRQQDPDPFERLVQSIIKYKSS